MKKVDSKDLINWWLEKYHNTNLDKVMEENPDWKNNPQEHTREFYAKYPVTSEQEKEWETWAKEYFRKVTGMSKKYIESGWWSVYLNTSPSVINEENE